MPMRTEFWVSELDCSDEVLVLEQVLSGCRGIMELDFDIVRAKMIVQHDEDVISTAAIIEKVAQTGMTATLWSGRSAVREQLLGSNRLRLALTAVSGISLVAGIVLHVLLRTGGASIFEIGTSTDGRTALWCEHLCYVLSILAGIWFVAPKAWKSLKGLRFDMNFLMATAVLGAMLIDEFLEAATVTFLFSLALLLEQWSMERTRREIASLMDLSPPTARCLDRETGNVEEIPVERVAVGTTLVVGPHERIPLDGVLQTGTPSINEAPITGESLPVEKRAGDELFAGTINEAGAFELQVTHVAADTTLARIVHMVEEAYARRAASEQWVETFARYYTPAMMALALSVAILPPLLFAAAWPVWIYRALVLLVIACPCALVISTPVSIVSALASAASKGILIKGGRYLEASARLKVIAVDKTGTLTYGRPDVREIVGFNGHTAEEVLQLAADLECQSQHPLARAILHYARARGIMPQRSEEHRALSGRGVEGVVAGKAYWIGSHRLLHESGAETPEIHERATEFEDAGQSIVAVGTQEQVCGLIGIADAVREGVAETIAALKRVGIQQITMLTGDNPQTAQAVGRVVGIDRIRANLLPEDKLHEVETLRKEFRSVAMVGDGVNDAPAMAVSSLGIAMGAIGSDAAIEAADVALMSDDLSRLPWLIRHAHRTLAIVKQNICFALGLKLLFVVLTFGGAASLWMAIAADTGASLLVIFNGLRLLRS